MSCWICSHWLLRLHFFVITCLHCTLCRGANYGKCQIWLAPLSCIHQLTLQELWSFLMSSRLCRVSLLAEMIQFWCRTGKQAFVHLLHIALLHYHAQRCPWIMLQLQRLHSVWLHGVWQFLGKCILIFWSLLLYETSVPSLLILPFLCLHGRGSGSPPTVLEIGRWATVVRSGSCIAVMWLESCCGHCSCHYSNHYPLGEGEGQMRRYPD